MRNFVVEKQHSLLKLHEDEYFHDNWWIEKIDAYPS